MVANMTGSGSGPGFAVPNAIHWVLLLAAVALTAAVPVAFLPAGRVRAAAGLVLMVLGAGMWWSARTALITGGTSPNPADPSEHLVEQGPYRLGRHPTYLGLVLVFLGTAVVFNSLWLFAFAGAEIVLADIQARREERYLETRFGDAYAAYRSRVRRWL